MKASILALILALAPVVSATPTLAVSDVQASDWLGDIQPPTQVNERIWRSGRPTEAHLRELWARGVRVIIDLEQDAAIIRAEGELARSIGFEFHSYPTDSFWSPDDAKMNDPLQRHFRKCSIEVFTAFFSGWRITSAQKQRVVKVSV